MAIEHKNTLIFQAKLCYNFTLTRRSKYIPYSIFGRLSLVVIDFLQPLTTDVVVVIPYEQLKVFLKDHFAYIFPEFFLLCDLTKLYLGFALYFAEAVFYRIEISSFWRPGQDINFMIL